MNELAASLAGHDKGCIYAIVRQEGRMVYLADGRLKKLDHPKKKNIRHIRHIKDLPEDTAKALRLVKQDSDLVHVLRLYASARRDVDQ